KDDARRVAKWNGEGGQEVSSRLLTTKQVAERLGLSPQTVSQHAKRGVIPGASDISPNQRRAVWRFDADVLEAWLASRRTGDPWRKPDRESVVEGKRYCRSRRWSRTK